MSKSLNNEILVLLKCPVCFSYMRPPVVSCFRGHSVCYSCSQRGKQCPQCKCALPVYLRNDTLDAITKLLDYPCPFAKTGCEEYKKFDDINDHAAVCSYRLYPCILEGTSQQPCKWKGSRFELANHVLVNHQTNMSISESNRYHWKRDYPLHEIKMILAYGELFYLHRTLIKSETKAVMYWALQYVGRSEDKIQYNYVLTIACDEYEHRSMTFSEQCCDDLKAIDEITQEDFCVGVLLEQLETFLDKNEKLFYRVDIRKV